MRARSLHVPPGCAVPWHSTGVREELIVALEGAVEIEWSGAGGRTRRLRLEAGSSVFLSCGTRHRVVNRRRKPAHYIYVTGPAR